MTFHQSSAVSVATLLIATVVMVVGYRLGRSHAAWRDVREARRDVRDAKRAVRVGRRHAWSHTVQFAAGAALVLTTLFVAAFDLSR
jgi:hypothetical protein